MDLEEATLTFWAGYERDRLGQKEMLAFLTILEAYRKAYQDVADLPVGHPRRAGWTQRRFRTFFKTFDQMLTSMDAVLPLFEE